MARTIEVIYEDNVFKPVFPVEGIKEHEHVIAIISTKRDKEGLRSLAGTLSHEEADEMMRFIDQEFGKIEGDW